MLGRNIDLTKYSFPENAFDREGVPIADDVKARAREILTLAWVDYAHNPRMDAYEPTSVYGVFKPEFDHGPGGDWKTHVPKEVQAIWQTLPVDARAALYYTAYTASAFFLEHQIERD